MKNIQFIINFCGLQFTIFLILALVNIANADNDGTHFQTATSSYARVQYANKPNISKRFGIHRDPTIQYVSFDQIFNKYNSRNGVKHPEPVILGSTRISSMSSKEESVSASVKEKSEDSQRLNSSHLDREIDTSAPQISSQYNDDDDNNNNNNNNNMGDLHSNWENAPDLTNGWEVKKLNFISNSKQSDSLPVANETDENLVNRTSYTDSQSFFNKGIDQVYAYSNFYQNYNDEKNNPVDRKDAEITQEITTKSTTAGGAGEYAHAISDGSDIFNLGNEAATSPPEVMETSWTDKKANVDKNSVMPNFSHHPKPIIRERIDISSSDDGGNGQVAHGQIGGQSAWRPFAGPTIPVTNPTTRSNFGHTFKITTGIEISSTPSTLQPNSGDTLFYSEAQKAALAAHNRNKVIFDGPAVLSPNNQNRIPQHFSQLPHGPISPQHQHFPARPNAMANQSNRPQVLVLPSIADNEITNNMQPPHRQNFHMPTISDGNNRPVNIHFSQDRPPLNLPPDMHRPMNLIHNNGPPPHQQRFPPQVGLQNNPSSPRPLHFNRFPEKPRPNGRPFADSFSSPSPHLGENINNRPFSIDRPNSNGLNPLPAGPVGLSPQLLPNQGRPIPQPGHSVNGIPLPKPGPIGTSPNNPLPGPPIPLPGIPSGPITIANLPGGSILGPMGRPNNDNNPERNPHNNHKFPVLNVPDRQDGPIHQGHDNFIGPVPPPNALGQRNPNIPSNNFIPPNFQRPPIPPHGFQQQQRPQQPPSSSPTSLLKSFFSRFFPFARSLKDDDVPIVDIDKFTNGTNVTALALDPELFASFVESARNATGPVVMNIERVIVDKEYLNGTSSTIEPSS